MHTRSSRAAALRLGAPAAVIGTLAATFAAAPADAVEPARSQSAASGIVPAVAPRPAGAVRHAATQPTTCTVRQGDTVSAIAIRYGLRPADVLAWNGLGWRSVIRPGQTLRLTPPATPAAAPAASEPSGAKTHTVAAGDTVYAIARRYGTTVAAIVAANRLGRSAIIYPGQRLALSAAPAAAPASATAKPATAASAPASAKPKTHTVARGDTLFGIARKYGTTVAALLRTNGLGSGSIIYPGQSLLLGPAQLSANLDATQRANALHIIRIGRELGVPDRGIAIALATAMVESSMRNLDHGDRDSLGLFQQRPSQGWGTAEQIRDADRSIRVFYGGRHDPNGSTSRGLLDLADWQNRVFTDAAQAVQISAYPDRYGQWEQQAHRWVATLR
ncbi:LysM peptidoglycan-binding domain-containing protein [Microbacterium sp. ARD32]|uniref:muramidase family protein n=1 Tax=Microbacterium sp. ARD32 TaxID=2962577 RepID=UPI002881498E|nr:LysM peptidoglycan-binding domain-containing protein [Microbacterium sp. ARD32]MDT0157545.1 LysM peptidoglycan-binding domain-containing protein [Microbacterium sp. ARD32]